MNKKIVLLSVIFFLGLFLSSCSLGNKSKKVDDNQLSSDKTGMVEDLEKEPVYSGQMKKFSNYNELASFLKEKSLVMPSRSSYLTFKLDEVSSINTPLSYSLDNKQNIDLSRADIIKTEGDYIYAVSYEDLYIIKASEDSIQVLAKLTLYSKPSEIYINKGKLVVIGVDEEIMDADVYKNFSRQRPYTFVKIFDLQNQAAPTQIRDLDFEGSYLASRFVNNQLYLILDNFDEYVVGEPVVPRLVDGGRILPSVCSEDSACYAPEVYYFDTPYDRHRFISINTLDLSSGTEAVEAQSYILNSDQDIYISNKNIYLTYAHEIDTSSLRLKAMQATLENKLSENELTQVDKIKSANNLVLNRVEKEGKIQQVYDNFLNNVSKDELLILEKELDSAMQSELAKSSDKWQETLIYKLSLGTKLPVYQAKGSVSGFVDSVLLMNEDASGNLRLIASTDKKDPLFSGEAQIKTDFYILSPQLDLLSSIDNVISEEKLEVVRFLGSRIYLSTTESKNNFYVVDASQINNPRLLGPLNLGQPLAYLYPYNESTLIGLGREVQSDVYGNEKLGGMELSLIDVSDINNPLKLDSYSLGSVGSNSLTLTNHQDFLFKEDKNILAVPASLTTQGSLSNYFDGVLFFSIENEKLVLRGQVDHSDSGKYQLIDPSCSGLCYNSSVKRIFDINDLLYTFSNKYIKVNNLSDFSLHQILKLIPDTEIDTAFDGVAGPDTIQPEEDLNPVSEETTPIGPVLPQEEGLSEDEGVASSSDAIMDDLIPVDNNTGEATTTDPIAPMMDDLIPVDNNTGEATTTDPITPVTDEADPALDPQILP